MKASERGQRRFHPTQRPVALAEWVLNTIAPEAKTALDLFVGSGPTANCLPLAQEMFSSLEWRFPAPSYVEQTILRWQNLTGDIAILDGKDLLERKSPSAEKGQRQWSNGEILLRYAPIAKAMDYAYSGVDSDAESTRNWAARGLQRSRFCLGDLRLRPGA